MTQSILKRPVLCTVLLAAGCGGAQDDWRAELPDVVFVVLDTVRADRLSCYGGPSGATPRLDQLADSGDRYSSCMATAPWTLPSHASMFTGLFPFEHGSHGFRVEEFVDNVHPLHPDHVTLAEELRDMGYRTSAFVANRVYLAPRHGMDQGFEVYEPMAARADGVLGRAIEHLESAPEGDPLFLFVNLMDAHRDYVAYTEEELAALPQARRPGAMLEALCELVMNDGDAPGALGDEVLDLYDRAIQRQDAALGRFFDELNRLGRFEDAVIVVTSDHGEAFGTHGVVEHAKDVYEPLVSVPLVLRGPGQSAGRVLDEVASHVDVGGLIARHLPGAAAEALAEAFPRTPGDHPVLSEVHFARPRDLKLYGADFQRERTALREGPLKLIVGGDQAELYDVLADPGELNDLSSERPGVVGAMRARLDAFLAAHAYGGERLAPRPLSAVYQRRMQELGYGAGRDK